MSDCLDCKPGPRPVVSPGRWSNPMAVFTGVKNPIEAETTDPDEYKAFFEKHKRLVPFSGSAEKSGHRVLKFYDLLYRLSPTHGSCIAKKNTAAFGMATSIRLLDPEFDTGEDAIEPSVNDRKAYRDALKQITFDRPLREFASKLGANLQAYGNGWMELQMTQVNGQYRASLKIHAYDQVLYIRTTPGEDKLVAVSPLLSHHGMISPEKYDTKDVQVIPVFPAFKNENGVLSSMFHLRGDGFEWYGRPESQSADYSKFEEVIARHYRLKSTHTGFSAGMIVEVASPNPIQEQKDLDKLAQSYGFSSYFEMFQYNFTNRGDNSQGLLFMRRTETASPFTAHNMPSNTNGGYFRDIAAINQSDIIAAHGVTGRFMSVETSGRYAQNSAFLEDYVLNVAPTINNLRNTVCTFINKAITEFWKYSGQEQMNEQSLWFNGPLDTVGDSTMEKIKSGVIENKPITAQPNDQPDNNI